jgi:hypothetical protein
MNFLIQGLVDVVVGLMVFGLMVVSICLSVFVGALFAMAAWSIFVDVLTSSDRRRAR